MRAKLAVAFAVLLFASVVRADQVSVDGIPLIIPDGSTVTSTSIGSTGSVPPAPTFTVDYSFADGTGFSEFIGGGGGGDTGEISFTNPVSSVEISFFGSEFEVNGLFFNYNPGAPPTDSATLVGPITYISWQTGDVLAGITSFTVPEPSSLLLSGMGLAALIGLARRNRTKGRKAMV